MVKKSFSYRDESVLHPDGREEDARIFEGRAVESRVLDAKVVANIRSQATQVLPILPPPPGYEIVWVSENFFGIPTPNKVQAAMSRGCEIVHPDEYPEVFFLQRSGEGNFLQDRIHIKGSLCMKRLVGYAELEQEEDERRTQGLLNKMSARSLSGTPGVEVANFEWSRNNF